MSGRVGMWTGLAATLAAIGLGVAVLPGCGDDSSRYEGECVVDAQCPTNYVCIDHQCVD